MQHHCARNTGYSKSKYEVGRCLNFPCLYVNYRNYRDGIAIVKSTIDSLS